MLNSRTTTTGSLNRLWITGFILCLSACTEPSDESGLFSPSDSGDLPVTGDTYGACVLDINGDDYPDIMLSTHSDDISLFTGSSKGDFRRFSPTTSPGGLFDVHGSASCDFDNDGLWDAYITVGAHRGHARSRNQLWMQFQSGKFHNIAEAQPILEDAIGRGRGAIWADFDRNSSPELLILNYESPIRLLEMANGEWLNVTKQLPVVPDFPYWLNSQQTPNPAERRTSVWSHSACVGDLNNDSWADLFISSRLGVSGVWLNDRRGNLHDRTSDFGLISAVWPHLPSHSAVGDLDEDGDLDLVLTYRPDSNVRPRRHSLEIRLNQGADSGRFAEALIVECVPEEIDPNCCVLADFDNDGHLDIYLVVRGEHAPEAGNLLLQGLGNGRFRDRSSDWGGTPKGCQASESAIAFDFDLDGDLDLFTCNGGSDDTELNRGVACFTNQSSRFRGVTLQLEDSQGAPHGLGARVNCAGQMREVASVATPLSSSILPVHFGLGESQGPFPVEIQWMETDSTSTIQHVELPASGTAYRVRKGEAGPEILSRAENP